MKLPIGIYNVPLALTKVGASEISHNLIVWGNGDVDDKKRLRHTSLVLKVEFSVRKTVSTIADFFLNFISHKPLQHPLAEFIIRAKRRGNNNNA